MSNSDFQQTIQRNENQKYAEEPSINHNFHSESLTSLPIHRTLKPSPTQATTSAHYQQQFNSSDAGQSEPNQWTQEPKADNEHTQKVREMSIQVHTRKASMLKNVATQNQLIREFNSDPHSVTSSERKPVSQQSGIDEHNQSRLDTSNC